MDIDRQKKIVIQEDDNHVRETHVVEDLNRENNELVRKVAQLIWLLFGILEALISFRILFKLIAANPNSWFVSFVYQLTSIFVWPFQNIVANPSFLNSVLEISSFIAILAYALIGWGIVRLIWLLFYHRSSRSVTTYEREDI